MTALEEAIQEKPAKPVIAKIGYFGMDRYFDSSGSLLMSTDAPPGLTPGLTPPGVSQTKKEG